MHEATMRRAVGGVALTLALAVLVAACGAAGSPATTTPTERHPGATATPAATEAPTSSRTASTSPAGGAIYDPRADPSADIAAALAASSADGKPVLLDFGADWCPDCIVLARMFDSPAFAEYLDAVHVVRIDVGVWDHNLDVSARYADPIKVGIPAVVLLSPKGKVVASTADGRLASAASMTPDQVLAVLESLGTP